MDKLKHWFRVNEMLVAEIIFWFGVGSLFTTVFALIWVGYHCPIPFIPKAPK